MSYDQWKTTDPRDYEPSQEEDPTELEMVYDELYEMQRRARSDAAIAASRIDELTFALEEALKYFKDKYDVHDWPDGKSRPNEEMCLGQMIDEALHGIRF